MYNGMCYIGSIPNGSLAGSGMHAWVSFHLRTQERKTSSTVQTLGRLGMPVLQLCGMWRDGSSIN